MHQVHCVIEVERPVLVPMDEVKCEILNDIGSVGAFRQIQIFSILVVVRLPIPSTGGVVGQEFIKAPIARQFAHLPPFAGLARCVAGLFQERCHGEFVSGFRQADFLNHSSDDDFGRRRAGASRFKEDRVWITGGAFTMGSDASEAEPQERPAHRVRVSAFWIDRTDVTNAQFQEFVNATGYVTTAERAPVWNEIKKQLALGTPKPPDDQLVAASLVFVAPDHPVPLDDVSAWWRWTPGANWRESQGLGSSIKRKACSTESDERAHEFSSARAGVSLGQQLLDVFLKKGSRKMEQIARKISVDSNVYTYSIRPTTRGIPSLACAKSSAFG
jgi:hypothetical protein